MFNKIVSVLCIFLPSAPTRFLYRLCGYHIGKNVKMPSFTYIRADEMTIGNDVDIRKFVYIHVRALTIGASTIISYGNQIKGDASFACGDNCFLGVHCLIHCAEDVRLGFYSGLGPRCTVYTHGSFLPVTLGYPVKFAPVFIEDYVWIAMNVTIMAGAHVETNCIINPGIVVQGRVRSNSIVQIDPKQYMIRDVGRLQNLYKKDVALLYDHIISSFLDSRSEPYQYDAGASSYSVPGRFTFVSLPDKNGIELRVAGETIFYDLGQFFTDASRRPIHEDFLSFIRFRHGIILRTRPG